MQTEENLLIFGASGRAAAFSALRAGLSPWCADLFGDADLLNRCAAFPLPAGTYPHGFLDVAGQDLKGPWMYTGGLENRPNLVHRIARLRPLWGNDEEVLALVRSPLALASIFSKTGVPYPSIFMPFGPPPSAPEPPEAHALRSPDRWLVKPLASVGGTAIRFWNGQPLPQEVRRHVYYQEYLEGSPCSAVYVAQDGQARLLGVTEQLIGASWLHAAPFHYCGSVGPLALDPTLHQVFERIGNVLAERCYLKGIFGVDCVLRDGIPWPVEVNPRYTASVEIHEYAAGIPALALHRQVFDRTAPEPTLAAVASPPGIVGKAILFARGPLTFPEDGPWMNTLRQPGPVEEMPAFADIPRAGQHIEAGRPILTFFARADSPPSCLDALKQIALDLDQRLTVA